MADKKFDIVFNAKLELGNMKTALEQISKLTTDTSLNLPKGITSSLNKTIQGIRQELLKLESFQGAEPSAKAAANINKAYTSIAQKFQGLKSLISDLGKDFAIDPKRFFPPEVVNQIKDATAALDEYYKKIKQGPQGEKHKQKVTEATDLRKTEKTALTRKDNVKLDLVSAEKYRDLLKQQESELQKVAAAKKQEAQAASQNLKALEDQAKKEAQIAQLAEKRAKLASLQEKQANREARGATNTAAYKDDAEKADKLSKEIKEIEDYAKANQQAGVSAEQRAQQIENARKKEAQAAKEATQAEEQLKTTQSKIGTENNKIQKYTSDLQVLAQTAEESGSKASKLEEEIRKANEAFKQNSLQTLISELEKIGITIPQSEQSLEGINGVLSRLNSDTIATISQRLNEAGINAKDLGINLDQLGNKNTHFNKLSEEAQRAANDMAMLKSRIEYFFSSINMINLFRRTVRQAINTVKELDAVMTETAVVTDFTVSDMWDKLPEYAAHAKGLGSSIKDVYAATTLYYQQGLKTNEAMGVGVETMKMARIANLEAGDATQYMTAALRGFNMEVNELNAERVNDVYSELAAITAADTSQIATAMSKTASIASAANMEFETTAALLAQIIETTQEAPETAGTALKTIIARFSEVKKLREEGQMTGEDEEGEAIDVNKIQGALRTVGISMDDFFAGTEGLDSILLKLAEKWKDLDFETQRYIATTAAGSRQQSRFIAMMSDYERTMELATAANNSAGASQQQFDKTLESMEAKLQKLKNAWNEFTMGLANNEILKFGVDALTQILTTINNLTSALSGGNGLIKSVVNLVTVIGAIAGGRALFEGVLGNGSGSFSAFKNGLIKSLSGNKINLTQQITGNKSEKEGEIEGEKAGRGWKRGFERASTATGAGKKVSAFFGKDATITREITKKLNETELKEYNRANLSDKAFNAWATKWVEAGEREIEATEELGKIYTGLENKTMPIEEASERLKKLGISSEIANEKTIKLKQTFNSIQLDFASVGMAAMGAGTAINLLGGLFEKLGMTEAAESMQKLGTAITGVGAAVMALNPLINMLGITVSSAGVTIGTAGVVATIGWLPFSALLIGIVAIIAGLTAGISWLVKNRTISGRLKEAEKATEKLNKATEETKQQYEELNLTLDSLEESYDKIQNLVYGTQEWREEVANTNQALLELADTYEGLSEFIKIGKNGVLYIDYNEKNTEGYGAKDILGDGEQKQQYQRIASMGLEVYSKNLESEKQQKTLGGTIWDGQEGKQAFDALGEALVRGDIQLVGTEDEIIDTLSSYLQRLDKNIYGENITDANIANTIATEITDQYLDDLKKYAEIEKTSDTTAQMVGLVSEALQQASLTTEQRGQFTNVIDTQRMQGFYDTELDRLEGLDTEAFKAEAAEYVKAIYGNTAKILGNGDVEYKDSEGNKQKVGRNDYEAQVAAIKAQEKASGYLEETAKALSGVSKQYQKEAKGLLTNQLTSKNLDNMKITSSQDKDIESKVESYLTSSGLLEQATELGFANGAAMVQYYTQQVIEAQKAEESIYNKFDDLDTSGKESQKAQGLIAQLEQANGMIDLTTAQTKDLVDSLYQVAISGGDITQLMGYLNTVIRGIDPSNMEQAMSYISSTNWYDENSIQSTLDALEEFGAEIDDSLVASILKASNAVKSFSLEKFNQQLQNVENIRDKVTENIKNKEATYSKEDIDTFIELGLDTSDFFKTGFDEYTYTGEQESLLTSIDSKVGSILSEMTGDIDQAVARGEGLKTMFEEGTTWQNGLTEQQIIENIVGGAYGVGAAEGGQTGWVSTENAQLLLSKMYTVAGITPKVDVNTMGPESIQAAMETLMQYLYKLPENLQIQKQNNEDNLQQQYYQKSGSELLNIIDTSTDAEQIDLATQALAAQAAQAGVTANEIEYYKKKLQESGKSNKNLEEKAMEMATRIKIQQARINEASAAIGEYLETMDDASKGSQTYLEALAGIPEQLEKAFGFEPSMEWVESNLQLIKDWAAGSEEAGERIANSLSNNLLDAMAAAEAGVADSMTQMMSWLDWFSETNVWAYAELDPSGVYSGVTTALSEAQRLEAKLKAMGFETKMEIVGWEYANFPSYDPSQPWNENTGNRTVAIPKYKLSWADTGGVGNYNAPSNYTPKSGGGGGGGGGSESKKWENPYDEFYNTIELLNEELRTREKLERRYQKLLDNTNTKASDLVKNAREQLDSLQLELKTRQELLAGRERQMADIEREYNDLSSYASYNEEKQVIEIDWTKIEALDGSTNEELTSRIEEYIDKLEEQQDLIEEEQDSIAEIEDAVKEIREQGKDEYFDLESQIKEALEQARQEEIDRLSEINDSINDTNSRLIDAMQSSIDKYRQDRENERTEEELSDKQRRLAYLQQDTSGANALEILQLQEEITQGQEDYTDTLIDQKISELQEQNDKAAEQRQQQIDLMQAQLDHYLDSELVWADIYSLMNSGIGPDGIIAGSALEQLLMEGASFEAMSYLEKMKWLEELENNVAKAVQWLMEGNSTEALMAIGDLNKGQKIEFTTADGEKVSGTLDEAGNVITDSGEKYEGVYRTYNGAFVTQENYIKPEPPKPVEPEPEPEQPAFTPPQLTDDIKRGVSAAIWNGNYGWGVGGTRTNRLAEVFGANDIQRNYVDRYVTSGYSGSLSDYSYINMRRKFKQYKTGGLADFTGPAWLDGTKSKPEYVLNSEQTKSFFQLIDVLGSLRSGINQSSQITGDSIYDVDINVESIGNDYDVEQLASTIKRMINDDARYRNNNAINLQR